jgi:hypothetical protein
VIVADPAATPVTTPDTGSTVAAAALLLSQVPPPVPVLVNTAVEPAHIVPVPLTVPAAGRLPIVTMVEAVASPQTEEIVYVIVVVPAVRPDTIPPEFTVAADVLLLLQVPPGILLIKVVVEPVQTKVAPLSTPATGSGLTVTAYVAVAVPQTVVTV